MSSKKYTKLNESSDERGHFKELAKGTFGQVSFLVINPGHTRGEHYHKKLEWERFILLRGTVRTEKVGSINHNNGLVEYVYYPNEFHSFKNVGKDPAYLLIIRPTAFNPKHPDTYHEEPVITRRVCKISDLDEECREVEHG